MTNAVFTLKKTSPREFLVLLTLISLITKLNFVRSSAHLDIKYFNFMINN